jgi:hypothetical protein
MFLVTQSSQMRDFMPAARVIVTNHHHTVIPGQCRNYIDKVTCFAQRTNNDCIRIHSKKVK